MATTESTTPEGGAESTDATGPSNDSSTEDEGAGLLTEDEDFNPEPILETLGLGDAIDAPQMLYTACRINPGNWLDGENVLISAGTAWNNPGADEEFTITVPDNPETLFIDSGGYQTLKFWGGTFPFSPKELFDWADSIDADYVAGMDTMCLKRETIADMTDQDVSEVSTIPERIEQTIDKQIEQYEVYQENDYDFDFIPVLQGYTPEDYRYCAHRLKKAGVPLEFVTVGSTAKRDVYDHDKVARILEACHDELPRSEFHLLGAGKRHFQNPRLWGLFDTCDTHGWAMMPDGGFAQTKADEEIGYEHYKECLTEATEEMEEHETSEYSSIDSRFGLYLKLTNEEPVECCCGTELPLYGTDFEPGCRHCEQTKINRWDKLMARSEEIEKPTPLSTQSSLGVVDAAEEDTTEADTTDASDDESEEPASQTTQNSLAAY